MEGSQGRRLTPALTPDRLPLGLARYARQTPGGLLEGRGTIRTEERKVSGGHSGRVTPVPIPNTEVKPACADGTWGETPWESRSSPEFISDNAHLLKRVGIVAPEAG